MELSLRGSNIRTYPYGGNLEDGRNSVYMDGLSLDWRNGAWRVKASDCRYPKLLLPAALLSIGSLGLSPQLDPGFYNVETEARS